jgi:pilus assembly protein CpaF
MYDIFDVIYDIDQTFHKSEPTSISTRKQVLFKPYGEVLEIVRDLISKNHSEDLSHVITKPEGALMLRKLISTYITKNSLVCDTISDNKVLYDKIFEEMAGFGFLTKYLYDDDIEEININGYDDVEVETNKGVIKINEKFLSPMHCIDMIKKMTALGGSIIDGSEPIKDSYMSKGVRISGMIYPIIDEAIGGTASIRKQKTTSLTREQIVNFGTANDEELDFLINCLTYGVSVAISGSTGSGKTTDLSFLLKNMPDNYRIYTIEDSRELNLRKVDDNNSVINRVIQTCTNLQVGVDAYELLIKALRFHPHIIVPAEMRGVEAFATQEAGRTGHSIATTLHANSAEDAYMRILSMCQLKPNALSERTLMKMIIDAMPIMVFKKRLIDGTRKYMSIVEATDYVDGEVLFNPIFSFDLQGTDENGTAQGFHIRMGNLSNKLANRMLENGADINLVRKYADPKWKCG